MPCFKVTLAYDGTEFSGWQRQSGRRTVQEEFERAWHEITGETVRVTASGRTDAGVHAAGQVVGIVSNTRLSPEDLIGGLNAKLPCDAAVRCIEFAPEGFHATTDAKRKRYRYTIYNDRRRPVFFRRYVWHVPTLLNAAAMHCAAQSLVGTHDFASFQSAGSERQSTVRTIFAAEVTATRAGQGRAPGDCLQGKPLFPADSPAEADALIHIDVEGDGFLYNMVRSIAGTLAEVGRGRQPERWVADVIAARDRTAAGQTAPAHGLSLISVTY